MLEQLNSPGKESLSQPNQLSIDIVTKLLEDAVPKNYHLNIAEIGVGLGATSIELCKILEGHGTLHLFDFEHIVSELSKDLEKEGFTCVQAYGNSDKHWDSYHWSLLKLLSGVKRPVFNYVYLDGSHTALHEAATFSIVDRLLLNGGILEFDDYGWSYNISPSETPKDHMTEEQMNVAQVKMVVDLLVKPRPDYKEIVENRVFQKQ